MIKIPAVLLFSLLIILHAHAQSGYSNYKQQTDRISALAKNYPQLA